MATSGEQCLQQLFRDFQHDLRVRLVGKCDQQLRDRDHERPPRGPCRRPRPRCPLGRNADHHRRVRRHDLRDRPDDRRRAQRRAEQRPGTGYEQDIAYFNGELIVSDAYTATWYQLSRRVRPATLAVIPGAGGREGFVSGLGGDGLGGSNSDWYSVQRQRRRQSGPDHDDHARRHERPAAFSSPTISIPRSISTTPAATWSPPRPATQPTAATT